MALLARAEGQEVQSQGVAVFQTCEIVAAVESDPCVEAGFAVHAEVDDVRTVFVYVGLSVVVGHTAIGVFGQQTVGREEVCGRIESGSHAAP